MQIRIDKGIDINSYGPSGFSWSWLNEMDVGDSVLVTNKLLAECGLSNWDKHKFKSEMIRALKRLGMNGKSRLVENDDFRVWRIK